MGPVHLPFQKVAHLSSALRYPSLYEVSLLLPQTLLIKKLPWDPRGSTSGCKEHEVAHLRDIVVRFIDLRYSGIQELY